MDEKIDCKNESFDVLYKEMDLALREKFKESNFDLNGMTTKLLISYALLMKILGNENNNEFYQVLDKYNLSDKEIDCICDSSEFCIYLIDKISEKLEKIDR